MESELGISILHDPGKQTSLEYARRISSFEHPTVNANGSSLVAVHGIKGHPHKTWTHPNGEKWLEDYLPKDLPNARIMTFGYNAQVFTSSKGGITDFAEQLLQYLASMRRSADITERPIIFLCHSLGGLVVKKALLLAQAEHDAAPIRKATIAVVFMGTPHRGSQLASYADIAVACVKAVGFKTNSANIHQLKLHSEDLEELGTQFGSLLQSEKIKVLTFYELKPMKIAGVADTVIVPRWSAKLGLGPPLETIIPVDADHRQIAQFPSRDSKQYSLIRSNLDLIWTQIKSSRDDVQLSNDNEWSDILLWLDTLQSQSRSAPRNSFANGTCQWIHKREPFQTWKNSTSAARLWIFGTPGVGKTILTDYISEKLKSEVGNVVFTTHCHSYQSLNEPMHALIRDILYQMLQVPVLSAYVKTQLLDLKLQTNAISEVAFDPLLKVVGDILRGNSNIFLIVDGIDELNKQVLELESFLLLIRSLSSTTGLCKALIASRNTPPLEKLLEGWEVMEISRSHSLQDISIFLDQKLEGMAHLGHRRNEVMERLVSGSKGLFLLADLAVSELDHLRTWNEIESLLENGNRGLDITYATIIKQLDTSSKRLCQIRARALPLVSVACRLFHIEEITELLAVELSKGFVDSGNRLLGGWNTLSRACGPFLQRNDLGAIELIHASAREFLTSHPWEQSLGYNNIMGGSADEEMACICLTYLNFTVFGRIPGDEVEVLDIDDLAQQYPLLEYASLFWSDHFLRSKKISILQLNLLEQFLNSHCSVTWTTTFFPYFSLKYGEAYGTTFRLQQLIIVKLNQKLRASDSVDRILSTRCIEKCDRLLLDSMQDFLRMQQFHSGPLAEITLERKLRLAECYAALHELSAAEDVICEALESAQKVTGQLSGITQLTLRLQYLKLHIQMRIQERTFNAGAKDLIPEFNKLVEDYAGVFGPGHVRTLSCRHDLAVMHFIRRDFAAARMLLEPLHQKMVENLGHTSRVTQSVANNLASCANVQKEFEYAEKILQTIPELSKAAAEPLEIEVTNVHSYTLHSLSILAAVLSARGELHRSEILHQRVIDGFTALEGPKASRIYESAINKGQAIQDQFQYKEARKHYREWVKKSDHHLGPESKYSREMRNRLAELDPQEKKWKEMAQILKFPVIPTLSGGQKARVYVYGPFSMLVLLGLLFWTCLA